ncbi:hypothetical protein [Jiangella gansuensis]|uniref:hypothetical protein n=1 Tax=Jiangella gansuensis TaxID=281473 RepID=UPI00047A5C6B|nr:hypothetical protein [Jiangella gansuensis]
MIMGAGSRSRHYRAEELLAVLGPEEHGPRVRLELTRDYHRWLQDVHRQLPERWLERSKEP